MITNHTDLLNALIEKYGLKSYLEVGVNNPENNFDKISKRIRIKIGVDPCLQKERSMKVNPTSEPEFGLNVGDVSYRFTDGSTSDIFFKNLRDEKYWWKENIGIAAKFDLIFIDGLHHAAQVKRDFENSLRCLSDNGFILIHDCLPENEPGTKVPRETKVWWGDVYKFCMTLNSYDGIKFKTFNIDNGCCLVWKDKDVIGGFEHKGIDYDYYLKFGRTLMNVTDEVVI